MTTPLCQFRPLPLSWFCTLKGVLSVPTRIPSSLQSSAGGPSSLWLSQRRGTRRPVLTPPGLAQIWKVDRSQILQCSPGMIKLLPIRHGSRRRVTPVRVPSPILALLPPSGSLSGCAHGALMRTTRCAPDAH